MSQLTDSSNCFKSDYYDSLIIASPLVHAQNLSRFSRLADRITNTSLMINDDSNQTFNRSNVSSINDSIADISVPVHRSPVVNNLNFPTNDTLLLSSNDDVNEPVITEDDMARLLIFESFYELNQKFMHEDSSEKTFKLIEEFEQTCNDNLLVTKRLIENKNHPQKEIEHLNKFLELIRLERNIWCLLKALLTDRLSNENNSQKSNTENDSDRIIDMDIEEDMQLRLSDSELVARCFERNSMLREMQIVIDWLESVYDDDDATLEKMDFFSDETICWENTLHQLKIESNRKQTIRSGLISMQNPNLCKQMDPDAPIRNDQSLHDLDKEDENRLFHHLFKLIRSGKLSAAKSVAEKFGYFWLSSALEGWIFHHNPNFIQPDDAYQDSQHSSAIQPLSSIIGNPYRDLWKFTAWKCSKMEGTILYERALFATLSGNRSILMPLCNKWMDKLWAYFKCSLDVYLENMLIETSIPKPDMLPRSNIELPDLYWDNRLSPEEIFREIETQFNLQTSNFISKLEEDCYRCIVKCIILSNIDFLINNLFEWSKTIQANREGRHKQTNVFLKNLTKVEETEDNDVLVKVVEPNLLRLFAHIVICLENLNLTNIEKHSRLCMEILETYIGFLIEYKLVELTAFYSKFLPESKQIEMFATLLETIDNDSDRRLCLITAKSNLLNIPAILSLVVENIRLEKTGYQSTLLRSVPFANFGAASIENSVNRYKEENSHNHLLLNAVTDSDLKKINALDWFLLDRDFSQNLELLWNANAMIRSFMLQRKIDQAINVKAKLPSAIINQAYQEWKSSNKEDYGFEIENLFREYLCHMAYFEANEAFEKWHSFLYTTKPKEPVKPKTPMNRIADRVLFEQRLKQFEQDLDVWHKQISIQANNATKKILEFICFPNGIWIDLADSTIIEEIQDEQNRVIYADFEPGIIDLPEIDGSNQNRIDKHSDEIESVVKKQVERKSKEWKEIRPSQLDGLRRIYVPQFIFLLQSVYRDSGNFKECIRVADLLADESRKLSTTFTQQQLIDFLAKIREASIEILQSNSDPFGSSSN
ncbi:Nuclear pore complex protein [Sarcoptes scabiei]|uniref:Nuclear pore complex protein n=2 Tax=Sarcoptes scabiei TaxID=52283 RepID=A0A834VGN2_SARSC|nr:Nuclear pore complex protein [Sarcoptes scabiei]